MTFLFFFQSPDEVITAVCAFLASPSCFEKRRLGKLGSAKHDSELFSPGLPPLPFLEQDGLLMLFECARLIGVVGSVSKICSILSFFLHPPLD